MYVHKTNPEPHPTPFNPPLPPPPQKKRLERGGGVSAAKKYGGVSAAASVLLHECRLLRACGRMRQSAGSCVHAQRESCGINAAA